MSLTLPRQILDNTVEYTDVTHIVEYTDVTHIA